MSDIEIKDIAVIISGIVTAISTLLAVIITNIFNLKSANLKINQENEIRKIERKLEKVEEFYHLFEKWETNFINMYLNYYRFFKGVISYQDTLELNKKQSMLLPGEAQKLKMILHIHLKELLSDYNLVDKARGELVPFLHESGGLDTLEAEFVQKQENFERVSKEFKVKVANYINEL